MNPFEMVVLIIAIVMISSIIKTRIRARHGIIADEDGNERVAADPDAARLRDEVKGLKERIAVLERLATDEHGPRLLDREIEKLR
jgi:hypothetical protein